MKLVVRSFDVTGEVPDDVKLEDCEVVICKATISYPSASGPVTLEYNEEPGGKDEVGIDVISTQFTTSNGEVLEEAD